MTSLDYIALNAREYDDDELRELDLTGYKELKLECFVMLREFNWISKNVKVLQIDNCCGVDFSAIPDGLDELVIVQCDIATTRGLPKGLSSLCIREGGVKFVEDTDAKSIIIHDKNMIEVINLSDRTEYLQVDFISYFHTLGSLKSLWCGHVRHLDLSMIPKSLISMAVEDTIGDIAGEYHGNIQTFNGDVHFAFDTVRDLNASFGKDMYKYKNLKRLAIGEYTPYLRQWAGTLRHLRIRASKYTGVMDLSFLELSSLEIIYDGTIILPKVMKSLGLWRDHTSLIMDLSGVSMLRSIEVRGERRQDIDLILPYGVVDISISGANNLRVNVPDSAISVAISWIIGECKIIGDLGSRPSVKFKDVRDYPDSPKSFFL